MIYANVANKSGSGIYVSSGSVIVNPTSKLYGNYASLGENMTIVPPGSGHYTDDLENLNELFVDENIKVNAWLFLEDDVSGIEYRKLDYEEVFRDSTDTEKRREQLKGVQMYDLRTKVRERRLVG